MVYDPNSTPATQENVPSTIDKKVGGVASFALGVLALLFKSPAVGFTLLAIAAVVIYYERKNIAKIAVVSSVLGLFYKGATTAVQQLPSQPAVSPVKDDNDSSDSSEASSSIDPKAKVVFTTPAEHQKQEEAKKKTEKKPKIVQGHPAPAAPAKPPKPTKPHIIQSDEEIPTPKPIIKDKKDKKSEKPPKVSSKKPKEPEKKKPAAKAEHKSDKPPKSEKPKKGH